MKSLHKYVCMMLALIAGSLVAIGCDQAIDEAPATTTTVSTVSQ